MQLRLSASLVTACFMVWMAGPVVHAESETSIPTTEWSSVEPFNGLPAEASCMALESAISALSEQLYGQQPSFYRDPYNQLAAGMMAFNAVGFAAGAVTLAANGWSVQQEQGHIQQTHQEIRALQQRKAEKRCFER